MKRMYSQTETYSQTDAAGTKKSRKGLRKKSFSKPKMQAGTITKLIRKELYKQAETKHVTQFGSEVTINTLSTGSGIHLLSQPYPGVGSSIHQRIGNKIQPVGFSWKAVYHNNNTSEYQYVRRLIIQIQDGEKDNADVTGELFEGTANNDSYDVGNVDSLIRKVNREGFKVLKDDVFDFSPSDGGRRVVIDKCYVKLRGSQMYRDAGVTHAMNDRIVVVHIGRESDADEGIGSVVELSYAMDFYFKDF